MQEEEKELILSIDIGTTSGIVFYSNQLGKESGQQLTVGHNLAFFYKYLKELCHMWKPNLIVVPKPTRFYNTILLHGKFIGVVELIAQQREIPIVFVIDSSCKKLVLGKGKATKQEIIERYDTNNEHIADATMFAEYYFKQKNIDAAKQ